MNNLTKKSAFNDGETGFVVQAKGYLLTLEGLPSARVNNIICNTRGQRAIITALLEDRVEALLLDRGNPKSGDRFVQYSDGVRYMFGEELFGRTMNVLGEPIDGLGAFSKGETPLSLEGSAPSMSARKQMTDQLFTGMPAVDILVPIAKGQRQLITGPISSGITVFLEGLISNQVNTDVVCIYTFIGRPVAYIEGAIERIFSEKGNKNTIILATFSDEPAPIIYLAPTVALELAESFSWEGKDVLLVLDDLGNHAKYLREIALMSGQVPGRESYPGDMFYQQAHLLERGGRFNKSVGSGSITILPVLETNIEDISSLVSTNLVSATDGHLFFSPLLNSEGHFPAVIPEESVTRVGRKTQSKLAKQLSIRIQTLIAEYEKQRKYLEFGTQLSENTRRTINKGEIMLVFLDQEPMSEMFLEVQIVLLSLVFTKLFDGKDVSFARNNRDILIEIMHNPGTNKEIEAVVNSARRGTISIEQFLRKLAVAVPYFENICQQL